MNESLLRELDLKLDSGEIDEEELVAAVNRARAQRGVPAINPEAARRTVSRSGVGAFKYFSDGDIEENTIRRVYEGLWSGGTGSLQAFHTSSTQVAATSGYYYYDIYDLLPSNEAAEVQMSVTYGDISGSGAADLDTLDTSLMPTKAVYMQMRNTLLNPGTEKFVFNGTASRDFYAISIARARYKESVDPGNWQLTLGGSQTITLVDDSSETSTDNVGKGGRVYNIVSGSFNSSTGVTTFHSGVGDLAFGLFYPDYGIYILNPAALATSLGAALTPALMGSSSVDYYGYNHQKIFNAMRTGADFQGRSVEAVASTHYDVYVQSREFNYSNNPTFYNEETGEMAHDSFYEEPITYITTVGLYNDKHELLAVAKTNSPLKKKFGTTHLLKVRLDF